jgi:hypothetical protein
MARLCHVLAHASEAAAQVQAVGLLVKVPHTKLPIQSPWVAIMNRQTEIARKRAAELALPPAERSRAGMGPPPGAALPDTGGASDTCAGPRLTVLPSFAPLSAVRLNAPRGCWGDGVLAGCRTARRGLPILPRLAGHPLRAAESEAGS